MCEQSTHMSSSAAKYKDQLRLIVGLPCGATENRSNATCKHLQGKYGFLHDNKMTKGILAL